MAGGWCWIWNMFLWLNYLTVAQPYKTVCQKGATPAALHKERD